MRRLVGAMVAVASALACQAGEVAVALRPAFDGHFRPGAPVWLRATVANAGAGFEGTLDLVVDGLTWRQALRVGAQTSARVDVLVAPRSEATRARVVVRSSRGEVLHDAGVGLGLRARGDGGPLVVAVAAPRRVVEDLFGSCQATVEAGELPALAAGYAAVDALGFAGDGGEAPAAARRAIAEWVRGGGVVGFALEDAAPVRTESLLAELGGCAGRASSEEWLAAAAARHPTEGADGRLLWRLGLGKVSAGTQKALAHGRLGGLLRAGSAGEEWVDPGLHAAFRGARWEAALRWRLVGGAAALLAGGVLVALVGLRGRRRALRAALAAGVAAALAAVAWGVMLPAGRGTLEAACVLERVAGLAGERRTEVLCLEAVGRTRVRLDLGPAEAVVPFYRSADDAGGGGEAVIERDAAGRWTVQCVLTRQTRRCFAAWWPWRETPEAEPAVGRGDVLVRGGRFAVAEAQGKLPGEPWQRLDELREWGEAHRALAAWQARRAGTAATWRVRPDAAWQTLVTGAGLLDCRMLAAQVWTRVGD
ncbi:MAG TPA: hypothetical protein VNE39_28215 [Planctomycetota bacterium]|nr:hypothetical protein [Planctomycetota bacterium]